MDGCQGSSFINAAGLLPHPSPSPETPAADKPGLIYFHRETPACIARFRRYLDLESAHPIGGWKIFSIPKHATPRAPRVSTDNRDRFALSKTPICRE